MAIETELRFPAEGPQGPLSRKTKIKIRLKTKEKDNKTFVTQVELTTGDGFSVAFPEPPGDEGDPPTPLPKQGGDPSVKGSTPDITTLIGAARKAGGGRQRNSMIAIVCGLEPPVISVHEPVIDTDGTEIDEVTNFTIDHDTQDVLVDWLRDPHWTWEPKPSTKATDK